MIIDTAFYERCIVTLDKAYALQVDATPDSIEHNLYRSACVKEFEIILEQSGKLLKKALRSYFATSKTADRLVFKDIFRHATLYGLMDDAACERWLEYRDDRNNTAHDYGVNFAEEIIQLLPQFITDAKALAATIQTAQNP